MKLHEALRVQRGDIISFVGAGGKTAAMTALMRELRAEGWHLLISTTMWMRAEELGLFPHTLRISAAELKYMLDAGDVRDIFYAINTNGATFLYSEIVGGKVYGPPPEMLAPLARKLGASALLIEADVSRGKPFKVPKANEPVIIPDTTLAVHVSSMDAPDLPDDPRTFYEIIVKHVPTSARVVALQSHVDAVKPDTNASAYLNNMRGENAALLGQSHARAPQIEAVVLAELGDTPVVEQLLPRIGAVVLAAGLSSRMGQPKLLLPWVHDQPLVQAVLDYVGVVAEAADVVVVTGRDSEQIASIAVANRMSAVHNADYASGEMLSSIKVGLRAQNASVRAVLIVPGDQPPTVELSWVVGAVVDAYAEGKGNLIIPSYDNRRGHPILIDRRYWDEILALPEDATLRDFIHAHADEINYVQAPDDSILRDMDTPEDYERELARARERIKRS